MARGGDRAALATDPVAAYIRLRPCELVALRIGRLDASLHRAGGGGRGGGQSAGVGRSRPTRRAPSGCRARLPKRLPPRSPAGPRTEALVFTALKGGPLSRADFRQVRLPAGQSGHDHDGQAAQGLAFSAAAGWTAVSRPSAHLGKSAHRPGRERQGRPGAARVRDRQHHARHLRAPVPVRDGYPRGPPGVGPRHGRGAAWDGPSTDQRPTAWEKPQADDLVAWRRLRGSNPRGSVSTRFPGVCLRPLGQASAAQSSQPRHPPATRRRGDGIEPMDALRHQRSSETAPFVHSGTLPSRSIAAGVKKERRRAAHSSARMPRWTSTRWGRRGRGRGRTGR